MKFDFKNIASTYFLLVHPIIKDKKFYILSASYTGIIALLYLALPISIETLIGTITSTASIQPIIIVSVILFVLLTLSGLLTLLQKFLIEIYYRASFTRLTTDFFLKIIYSNKNAFKEMNSSDLNGRYFEIFNIQKSLSVLLVEGLLILLQLLVSIILVSFYHPYFLLLNLIFISTLMLAWRLFFNTAIQRAIQKSHAKYMVFSWLQDVFRLSSLFKSVTNKNFALNKAKRLMENYVKGSRQYWDVTLKQNILLVILYLFMTMALFSIGGFLVIKGQLSLGQLVAAEIIFTGVLYSISKLGYYFDLFYNLIASAEELQDVFSIKDENLSDLFVTDSKTEKNSPILVLKEVAYDDNKGTMSQFNLNFLKGNAHLLIFETNHMRQIFLDLIQNYIEPLHGLIQFNQMNISLYNQHFLRDQIFVIDDVNIFSCTIREFLLMEDSRLDHESFQVILDLVGLDKLISKYEHELDTPILGNGFPLADFEIVSLKLARALILNPQILVVTEIINLIPPEIRQRVIHYIVVKKEITLIHFSTLVEPIYTYDSLVFLSRATYFETNNSEKFKKVLLSISEKTT